MDRETGIEEARKVLGPLADDAALDGTITYLTRRGRRFAAIVPLDRIKEPAMTTVQTDPVAALIDNYIAGGTADLSDHTWASAAWGTRGPQGPAELRDITERLYGDVRTRTILIAEDSGRDNHDPDVLAEIDMDAIWTAACASHLTDWADTQIVTLREEEAATAAAHEAGDTEWPGQDHSERIARLAAMRNAAAKAAAALDL
jgi:hypothetical protein